jgi:putative DNA primase/helicase
VHPVNPKLKAPLTSHGYKDATLDLELIEAWRTRWPPAVWSIATGEISGVVALDFDLRQKGGRIIWGIDGLDETGLVYACAVTPTAHTPSGGFHQLFRHPGCRVVTGPLRIAGEVVPGVDIKGDGGSLILPPGPGRFWDPILGFETSLAPLPWWAI